MTTKFLSARYLFIFLKFHQNCHSLVFRQHAQYWILCKHRNYLLDIAFGQIMNSGVLSEAMIE